MLKGFLMNLILFYQKAISPWLGHRCRFYPSCSNYALEALKTFSFITATRKICWRLLRCGPWSRPGVDFVQKTIRNKERL